MMRSRAGGSTITGDTLLRLLSRERTVVAFDRAVLRDPLLLGRRLFLPLLLLKVMTLRLAKVDESPPVTLLMGAPDSSTMTTGPRCRMTYTSHSRSRNPATEPRTMPATTPG